MNNQTIKADAGKLQIHLPRSNRKRGTGMSENDYIAEYIKERHPGCLGLDFVVWKMARKISESVKEFARLVYSDEFQKMLSQRESEGEDGEV